ncbi:MAG TPA: M56 family metallopeptidase [Hyphomonadaceae bacterium]|jgi:beta-lactamase regulating signal transducer with metallopeptidase domain|nr:M56 family metallopeptidase [Hyphomonadaceae bacterium]
MTAADIIAALLAVNLVASIAILAVLGSRGALRRMAGAQAAYLSWLIVPAAVAACLIPARIVTIEMPVSSPTAAISSDAPSIAVDAQAFPAAPPVQTVPAPASAEISLPSQAGLPAGQVIDRAPGLVPRVSLDLALTIAAVVWAAGAIGALVFLFLRQALAVRALGPLARVSSHVWRAAQSAIGPAVVGIFAPRIVLPANFEAAFDDTERKVVLAHEEAHLKGRHTAVKALTEIAVCLNWFNPLAHLAARAIAMDQELACDETVVQRYPAHRKAYAAVLLKTQAGPRAPHLAPLGCYWPAASEPALKTRIVQIQRSAPGAKRRVVGGSLLVLAAIAVAGCAWISRPPQTRYAAAEQSAPSADQAAPSQSEPALPYPGAIHLVAPQQANPPAQTGEPLQTPPPGPAVAYSALPFGMDGRPASLGMPGRPESSGRGSFDLTGKVEKIEFHETSYVVFVRASYLSAPRNWQVAYLALGIQPNADLWELNPTNYFGDPDSRRAIELDLLNRDIKVTGFSPIPNTCQPACKMTKTFLEVLKPTALPALAQERPFGITEMLRRYDLSKMAVVVGTVKRIEFSDRGVFDIHVEGPQRGSSAAPVYQVRSEYNVPRADIRDRLLNQTILAAGWPGKAPADAICETNCGLYATDIAFEGGSRFTPMGERLVSPPAQYYWNADDSNGAPMLSPAFFGNAYNSSAQVMEGWDIAAPVMIEGKIVRRDDEGVWVEAQKAEPATMAGAKPGTLWRVIYPDLNEPPSANGRTTQWFRERIALEGRTLTVRGLMSVDKSCKPTCTMRGAVWKSR